MSNQEKARYWVGVLYPENMLPNWQDILPDKIQLPFAYCLHDLDTDSLSEHRKDHIHMIIVFSNTTTYNHALKTFNKLSAPGLRCINKCEPCGSVRYCYEYLIHNTETCKKLGKYLYPSSCRIEGNLFDIGIYEQLSLEEKQKMRDEISDFVIDNQIENYSVLYIQICESFPSEYRNVMSSYSSHFERLCKGNYQLAHFGPDSN